MGLFDVFRRRAVAPETHSVPVTAELTDPGLLFREGSPAIADGRTSILTSPAARPLLSQLIDDGYAIEQDDGSTLLPWDAIHARIAAGADGWNPDAIGCPPPAGIAPVLVSSGSLTDNAFSISIAGWRTAAGAPVTPTALVGAAVAVDGGWRLLSAEVWSLIQRVRAFAQRGADQRTPDQQRRAWGEIRRLAVQSGAVLDDFLRRSVVITADRLKLDFRQANVSGTRLVEVVPSVDNVPVDWLDKFDRLDSIPQRYDLPTPEGIVQVIVSPEVRSVLEEIKRMPGRRVTGARAERFLSNPVAALGPEASAAVDPEQVEEAKASAGIDSVTFTARIERDAVGAISAIGIDLARFRHGEEPESDAHDFASDEEVDAFVRGVRGRIRAGLQYFGWEGFDLEIVDDTEAQLERLDAALQERRLGPTLITSDEVYDLSHYSERIEGIGQEERLYVPSFVRKDQDGGWFPENVVPLILYEPGQGAEAVPIAATDALRESLKQAVAKALEEGRSEVVVEGLPKPVPLAVAQGMSEAFDRAGEDVREGKPPRKAPDTAAADKVSARKRVGLRLRANIEAVDYVERRARLVGDGTDEARLPSNLRAGVSLKPHQLEGVARMQRLFAHSPDDCRGALLADDMGLGKTLQLLTFLAEAFERDPELPPALIVAPVSLLENWVEEARKFFEDGSMQVLTVYGASLAALKADRSMIDEQLQRDGLVKFLKPGWRGDARLVLSTYETLRDLEFSFAAEHWSVFVCDEAQKIKNPSAAVTRAAKKQHARFKIACTGTPVENSLADLWCLFDFVQPGLLGALTSFAHRYRKPIEAKTDADRQRVEELRALIEPQVIRRTKKQVAKDLPAKIVDPDVRVPLSDHQRSLYAWALNSFRNGSDAEGERFKNHLGVLHYLRKICADPRTDSERGPRLDPFEVYRQQSPKLGWLIERLRRIQQREEKVLVFCEFREMQQMLAHYVAVNFGFMPDIINGDSPAAAKADASRQARLRVFQAKPGFGVIILSPLAVGFGVNIQAANHVIHFTRTWNPAKEDQATDRAYRIGQTKDVTVYYPTVYAQDFDTFEVKLDRLLTEKRELADDMLNGAGDLRAEELL